MASVGVRELRQRASEVLRRVKAGETIEVTEHGRPVALLTPLPAGGRLAQLRASGDLMPATVDFDSLPEPLPLEPGEEPPSAVLARLREERLRQDAG